MQLKERVKNIFTNLAKSNAIGPSAEEFPLIIMVNFSFVSTTI